MMDQYILFMVNFKGLRMKEYAIAFTKFVLFLALGNALGYLFANALLGV